ncbi:MAG: YdcF family protein, partial [Synechococcaceae bacterium WB6_3B_236]|nr:YdcF family protein [Synechococcaceae bacterium WB6_3B_236]
MRGLGRGLLRLGVLLGLAWGGWTLGQRLLQPLLPPPQEIFVLGGDLQREEVA